MDVGICIVGMQRNFMLSDSPELEFKKIPYWDLKAKSPKKRWIDFDDYGQINVTKETSLHCAATMQNSTPSIGRDIFLSRRKLVEKSTKFLLH